MKTIRQRQKQRKTDYGKRIKLLKSNSPRIIFRKTNKYIIVQYVTSKEAQDKIEFGINSKDLIKYSWPKEGSLKSTPASYFIGFLTGKKIIDKKLKTPIVDFGMYRVLPKTKTYAFLKGLIEAGIEIKCKKDPFPSDERIRGEHLKNKIPFNEIKSKIEKLGEKE